MNNAEIQQGIMAGHSQEYWALAFFWGLVGFILFKGLTYKRSKRNTEQFSIFYWVERNWLDSMLSLLLFFTLVRFKDQLFGLFKNEAFTQAMVGVTDNEFVQLAIGFCLTYIAKYFRKKIADYQM